MKHSYIERCREQAARNVEAEAGATGLHIVRRGLALLRKSARQLALGLAVGVSLAGVALAAETGSLRVNITGDDGQPLAGATVTVSSPDSLVSKSGVTEADGTIRLTGLDPATNYTVQVQASGYESFSSAANVAVVSNQTLNVGYALGVTALDTVTVTGATLAAIDTTSAQVGTTLNLDRKSVV